MSWHINDLIDFYELVNTEQQSVFYRHLILKRSCVKLSSREWWEHKEQTQQSPFWIIALLMVTSGKWKMLTLSYSAAGWRWMAAGVGEGSERSLLRAPSPSWPWAARASSFAHPRAPGNLLHAQAPFWVYGFRHLLLFVCGLFFFFSLNFPLVI